MLKNILYKRADSDEEINQILQLQRANYPTAVSDEEREKEGFVTVQHDFELLKKMNDKCPHIIAKYEDNVVGYALSMVKDFKEDIPVLRTMFQQIDNCLKPNQTYIVMGQICIDKRYRKQGIFRGLYNYMFKELKPKFDMVATEVDVTNSRSLNAHYAIGFKKLHMYESNNQKWEIISYQ